VPLPSRDNKPGLIRKLHGHTDAVTGVAILPDGKRGISASRDKTIRVWDLATGRELQKWTDHPSAINCLAVTHDGKQVLTGGSSFDIRLWETSTGKLVHTYRTAETATLSLSVGPIGRFFISGDGKGINTRWGLETTNKVRDYRTDNVGPVQALVHLSGGRAFASGHGGPSPVVVYWDANNPEPAPKRFTGIEQGVTGLAVLPDGNHIAATGLDGTLRVWDVASGVETRRLKADAPDRSTRFCSLAVTPNGKHAVVGALDKKLRVFNVDTGRLIYTSDPGTSACSQIAISPDGNWALTGGGGHFEPGKGWQNDGEFDVQLWRLP
jgi:WD40 repeat protein